MAKRKAAELEGFDESSQTKWKSNEESIRVGGTIIHDFLKEVAKLDSKLTGLNQLQTKLLESQTDNQFVQEVLKEF